MIWILIAQVFEKGHCYCSRCKRYVAFQRLECSFSTVELLRPTCSKHPPLPRNLAFMRKKMDKVWPHSSCSVRAFASFCPFQGKHCSTHCRFLPPTAFTHIAKCVAEICKACWAIVGCRICFYAQEVVKNTGGLHSILRVGGLQVDGGVVDAPSWCQDAEGVFHAPPARQAYRRQLTKMFFS